MSASRIAAACALALGLAACTSPRTVQAPPPPPAAPVIAAAPPIAQDWRDGPVTAGAWTYAARDGGGIATFADTGVGAAALFTLGCARGEVTIAWRDAGRFTIATTSIARGFTAGADGAAHVPARDAFLDAMAFSRGRMRVTADGVGAIVLPVQAEIGRVIEDCRPA